MVKKEFGLEEGLIKTVQIIPNGLHLNFICVDAASTKVNQSQTNNNNAP